MYVALIVLTTVFSMASHKKVMQRFLVVYNGIFPLSSVFSRNTHLPKSDSCDVLWYTMSERCTTSTVFVKYMVTSAQPDSTMGYSKSSLYVVSFINSRLVIWRLKFRTNSTLLIVRRLTVNSILVS